jgi:excisionase family DNA binding protein
MEPYLTIKECAEVLRLSEQTIQRYVMNKEIPYLKIKKVIRFRPADIDKWAENGGRHRAAKEDRNVEGDLFAEGETGETAKPETDTEAGDRTGEVTA